jgi:hypothetical protein
LIVEVNYTHSCGRQKIRNGRIVGGENAYLGEFPWMVSIFLCENTCGYFWKSGLWIAITFLLIAFDIHVFELKLFFHLFITIYYNLI